MRFLYAAVVLSLLLPAGCNTSGDAQNSASESTGSATPAGANFQLVKLKLPGMT
jgi:hypothetical protein